MERKTLSDGWGRRVPNPKAFGFEWTEAQGFAEELDRINELQHTAVKEMTNQKEHVRELEKEYTKARVKALLSEEAPDETVLTEARKKLEQYQTRVADLRRAVQSTQAELYKAVQENREKWQPELDEKTVKARMRRVEIADELRRALYDVEALEKLSEWLNKPETDYSIDPSFSGIPKAQEAPQADDQAHDQAHEGKDTLTTLKGQEEPVSRFSWWRRLPRGLAPRR